MTREELLAEGYRRGILPDDVKATYEEAMKRGLIASPEKTAIPSETLSSHGSELVQSHGALKDVLGIPIRTAKPELADVGTPIQDIAPYYRMLLEGGGSAAGMAAFAPAGPAGVLAGTGLGYSAGKTIADRLDEAGGVKNERSKPFAHIPPLPFEKKKTPVSFDSIFDPVGEFMRRGSTAEVVSRPVRDAVGGAGMAALSDAALEGIMGGARGAKYLYDKARGTLVQPATSANEAKKAAADLLRKGTSDDEMFAKNVKEAIELEKRINEGATPGTAPLQFSLGQRSADPNQIKMEMASVLPSGKAANLKVKQVAGNQEAISDFYQRAFKGTEGPEDLLAALERKQQGLRGTEQKEVAKAELAKDALPTSTAEETGEAILGAVKDAKKPVQDVLNDLKSRIPDYPMRLDKLKEQIELLKNEPNLLPEERAAIDSFVNNDLPLYAKNWETTTKKYDGIKRALNQRATDAYHAGQKDSVGRLFTILKNKGLKADLDVISDLAKTNKEFEYKGQYRSTAELAQRLDSDNIYLAQLKAQAEPDVDAMWEGIRAAGK